MRAGSLWIEGILRTRTALHIGSGRSAGDADDLLRRAGDGRVFIPGSAIAGSLRGPATRLAPRLGSPVCKALLDQQSLDGKEQAEQDPKTKQTLTCDCAVCQLFGTIDPREQDDIRTGGRASRLIVHHAFLDPPGYTWVRDGVGIDRRTGAAARLEGVKFDAEVVTAGATFRLRLEIEDPHEQDERLLAALLGEWCKGRATLGGRVARGLGSVVLEDWHVGHRRIETEEQLLTYLGNDAPDANVVWEDDWLRPRIQKARKKLAPASQARWGRSEKAEVVPASVQRLLAHGWAELEFALQAEGAFVANDLTVARWGGFDHAPLLEWFVTPPKAGEATAQGEPNPRPRPVLPGASLRGILRSQAERIARTLASQRAVVAGKGNDKAATADFLARCPACNPLARLPDRTLPVALKCCDALLPQDERETNPEDLCLACQLFGSPRGGSRLLVEDAPLAKGTEPSFKLLDFLAIDRFTGGGRDQAKFDALALWKPQFTVRLRLENPQDWELGWLTLVLRDLAEGQLAAGFGPAKGLGHVCVPSWTARFGFLLPEDAPLSPELLAGVSEPEDVLYRVREAKGALVKGNDGSFVWQVDGAADWYARLERWVQAFVQQVQSFERGKDGHVAALPLDNYFGTAAQTLYPLIKEV